MKIITWYKKRKLGFILERFRYLFQRYGLNSKGTTVQIECFLESLRDYHCFPTFFVPGEIVERHVSTINKIKDAGAEIAVHGYHHVDLKSYSPQEASSQLQHAVEIFRANDLDVHGFRCPYLSSYDDLIKALPTGIFQYSSNQAIQWPIDKYAKPKDGNYFSIINNLYEPDSAESILSIPTFKDRIVEIPVCVPDDLQLHDGLGFGIDEFMQTWLDILNRTHEQGWIFNLMIHTELASFWMTPISTVLQMSQQLHPRVWIGQLKEISDWWIEKSKFGVVIEPANGQFTLKFCCSSRATILGRGFDPMVKNSPWNRIYWQLEAGVKQIRSTFLPLIGLQPNPPGWVEKTLNGMGYMFDSSKTGPLCSLFIDESILEKLTNPFDLISYIECSPQPLIRFWPWPDGARSALCISADLDALSLFDYVSRFKI